MAQTRRTTRRPKGEPCPATPVPGGRPRTGRLRAPRAGRRPARSRAPAATAATRARRRRGRRRPVTASSSARCRSWPGWPASLLVLAGARRRRRRSSRPTWWSAGRSSSTVTGFGGALVALLVPVAARWRWASSCSAGAVPKFGLAYAGRGRCAGRRPAADRDLPRQQLHRPVPAVEVIAGERVLTSSVDGRRGLGAGRASRWRWSSLAGIVRRRRLGAHRHGGRRRAGPRPFGLAGAAVLLGVGDRAVRWRCRRPTSPTSSSPIRPPACRRS